MVMLPRAVAIVCSGDVLKPVRNSSNASAASQMAASGAAQSWEGLTLLGVIVDGCFELAERHLENRNCLTPAAMGAGGRARGKGGIYGVVLAPRARCRDEVRKVRRPRTNAQDRVGWKGRWKYSTTRQVASRVGTATCLKVVCATVAHTGCFRLFGDDKLTVPTSTCASKLVTKYPLLGGRRGPLQVEPALRAREAGTCDLPRPRPERDGVQPQLLALCPDNNCWLGCCVAYLPRASVDQSRAFCSLVQLAMAPRKNAQSAAAELSLVHLKSCLVNLPPSLVSLLVNVNTVRQPNLFSLCFWMAHILK